MSKKLELSSVIPNIFESKCLDSLHDSDIFTLFYMKILEAEDLSEFEASLFSFMSEVLNQRTCLFYSNINQELDKKEYVLQRGSYSAKFSGTILREKFPKIIQYKQVVKKQEYIPESSISKLFMTNFFSMSAPPGNLPFVLQFQKFQNHIRCGMLLSNKLREVYGILFYEYPLSHSYFISPIRLQQFQKFLSVALTHQKDLSYANVDQLTKLNRKYRFFQLATNRLYNNCDKLKLEYQLLMIDIDFFKKFNDVYGHLAGDNCLQAIARGVKSAIRNRDIIGRFGGEEFICLIQSDLKQALVVSQRIHQMVKIIQLCDNAGLKIPTPTVSIGIASFNSKNDSIDQLVQRADEALYRAKKDGRNQTHVFQ